MYSLEFSYIHDYDPNANYPPGGVDCDDSYRSHVKIMMDDCTDYNRLSSAIEKLVYKTFGITTRRERTLA